MRRVTAIQERLPLTTPDGVPVVDDPDDWHLDEHTREVGRRGLAEARKALAKAAQRAEAREAKAAA